MEGMHAPSEAVLDDLDGYFDPRRARLRSAAYLASWLDLDRIVRAAGPHGRSAAVALPTGRLRELTAAAADLSRWRGTAYGLARFLEVATGVPGFEVDDHVRDAYGDVRPFDVEVRVPAGAAGQRAADRDHRRLGEARLRDEHPAPFGGRRQRRPRG
ncbi:MAG: hypothetical protein U5K81_07125 [Trueperaceae bacterium]|nr:hypothetical protein [Trueperaceae bacterium]